MKYLIGLLLLSTPAFASFFIPNSGVTTAKIATGAVTQAKLATRPSPTPTAVAGGIAKSGTVNFTSTSGSLTVVTGATVTITTTGRPIFIGFIGASTGSYIGGSCSGTCTSISINVQILNGATVVLDNNIRNDGASNANQTLEIPPASVSTLDYEAAGTYTYTAKVSINSSETAAFAAVAMIAYEI